MTASTSSKSSAASPRFGSHMSIAGGINKAIDRLLEVDGEALQIFTASPNQWRAKPLDPADLEQWHAKLDAQPIPGIMSHGNYLASLGSQDDALWEKSIASMCDEIDRCAALKIPYLVFHPGAHLGEGEETGLARVAAATGRLLDHLGDREYPTHLLLETTAGQGTNLGYRFEHLAALIAACDGSPRLGVCMDTCHIFVAGYDIRTPEGWLGTMDSFDEIVGIDRLLALHLNDAAKPWGSRVDRHAHIGEGELGLDAFRLLVNDPRLRGLPMVLETPKGKDTTLDKKNLAALRSLIKR